MRKVTALLLTLITVIGLCSCGKKPSEPGDIVGTWYNSNYTEFKELLTEIIPDPVMYGVYYRFDENGEGKTWTDDGKTEFTFKYTYDGSTLTLTFDDGTSESISCTLDDGVMTVSDSKTSGKFKKQ